MNQTDWHVILCSGAEHLDEELVEHGVRTIRSSYNYDASRVFSNTDIYTRLGNIKRFGGKRVCVIQSTTGSGELDQFKMTTADRLVELLEVLDILQHPRSVYYEDKDVRVEDETLPEVIEVICLHTAFSKQDEVYRTGESNSARMAAELMLSRGADRLVFLDPHTPLDYDWLKSLCSSGRVHILSMYETVINTLLPRLSDDTTVVCTPGKQRTTLGWTLPTLSKVRVCTDEVLIGGGIADEISGKPVLLIDDMIISGTTILATRRHFASHGTPDLSCWITHSLPGHSGDEEKLRAVMREFEGRFYSSNSVRTRLFEKQYPENSISCVGVLLDYLRTRWHELDRETA